MAKSKKNYYHILGLTERATAEQIKKSFRQLAREYHPDHNPDRPDAAERFKAIQEAYATLSDPIKRRRYDQSRGNPFENFQAANGDSFRKASDFSYARHRRSRRPHTVHDRGGSTGGFTSFFSRIFGADEEPKYSRRQEGRRLVKLDVDTRLRLSFAQALRGGKIEVTLPQGEVVRLDIPKGVRPGLKIRLRGKGRVGHGSTGDLYVTFEVDSHPFYRRREDDLHVTLKISPFEAMLGSTRHVVNAYGHRIKVRIPAGVQPGTTFRLKGQGVDLGTEQGDLYFKIQISIPKDLTEEQRTILRTAAIKAKLIR